MTMSNALAKARTRRYFPKPRVELLEDRLQPGSVLTGLGFSLLSASLPNVDLFAPQDHADQIFHRHPETVERPSLPADLSRLTPVTAVSSREEKANTATTVTAAQEQIGASGLTLPLTSDLLALSAGSSQVRNVPVSEQHSGPALTAAQAPAAPVVQQPPAGNAAASIPALTQPQGAPHPVGSAATAAPIPAADLHHLTASVVTHVTADGQGDIKPDASVNWTTYVSGTTGVGTGRGVAVDASGNVYTTGYMDDGTTKMAFVAEYTSAGSLIARTGFQVQDPNANYIQSEGHAIAVDNAGGVYVTGKATDSLLGDTDAFIMKFDATNQLMPIAGYGGGIGGSFNTSGEGVAVDAAGEATIVGTYGSSATENDIFAAKYKADGSSTNFASYYLFTQADGSSGKAIALDSTGSNAYLAGSIHVVGGDNDILVMQIDNTTGIMNPSFFTEANPGDDILNGIAVDQSGQAYVAGTFAAAGGGTNGYVAAITADGAGLLAQYIAPNMQTGDGISLDPNTGSVFVVGSDNNMHVFVQKLNSTLSPGDSATISGSGTETGSGIAYDPNSGNAYVVGTSTSNNLATDGTTLNGTSDAFLSNVGSFG